MAYDKLIDSAKLDAAVTATADAIRMKSRDYGPKTWDENTGFANAVAGIQTGRAAYGSVSPESSERLAVSGLGFKPTIVVLYIAPADYRSVRVNELIFAEGGRRSGCYTLYHGAVMNGDGTASSYCTLSNNSAYTLTITEDGFEVTTSNPAAFTFDTSAVYNYVVGLDQSVDVLSLDGCYITDENGERITLTAG